MPRTLKLAALGAALAAITGCEWDWTEWLTGESSRAQLTLAIAGTSVEQADAVVLRVTGIELKPAGANAFIENIEDRDIRLTELTGTEREVVLTRGVPAGDYDWLRLLIAADPNVVDSFVEVDGSQYPLAISSQRLQTPSGSSISVASGGSDYTLAIDLRRGLTGNVEAGFGLSQTAVRAVRTDRSGWIEGTVASDLRPCAQDDARGRERHGTVYMYRNHNAPRTDIRPGQPTSPLTTAAVAADGGYVAAFLPEGPYSAAFTCSPDNPQQTDTLVFTAANNQITVTAEQSTQVDLSP
jgi:hypothetical protein